MKEPIANVDQIYRSASLRHISFANFSTGTHRGMSDISTDMNRDSIAQEKSAVECIETNADASLIETLESDKQYFKIYLDENEQAEKVAYLERTFKFLQQQHEEILKSLHDEVENLKRKNKELNFKLSLLIGKRQDSLAQEEFMAETPSRHSLRSETSVKLTRSVKSMSVNNHKTLQSEVNKMHLHNEINDLKETLAVYGAENDKLASALEKYKTKNDCMDDAEEAVAARKNNKKDGCHYVMQHLNDVNQQNLREIKQIQDHLHEVINSENVSLNAFMMAKGYHRDDDATPNESSKNFTFPRSASRSDQRKSKQSLHNQDVMMLLPPLKQTAKSRIKDKLLTFKTRPHFKP